MRIPRIQTGIFFLLFFAALVFLAVPKATAATNISATTTDHWAWNDIIGWMDFYNTNSVTVNSSGLTGWASSSAGYISLDCHNTPPSGNNICSQSPYQVTNDGGGNLSGWAWNDTYGWISFDCHNGGSGCGASSYEVLISPTTGDFSKWAWNDAIGWFSFNCADPNGGICGTSQYKVNTSWRATSTTATLDSSTYDTGVNAGAQLNSVLWQGSQPAGSVKFQFAVGNSTSGSWTTNFIGSDGTSGSYYQPSGPNISVNLTPTSQFANFRYFRYRLTMVSNSSSTISPRVDDVFVNWSP